jgi:hypothetical protein
MLAPKREEQEAGENYVLMSFITNTSCQFVLGRFKLRMRWAGHVAHMGEKGKVYKVLAENLQQRIYLEDLGKEGKIIFRCILNE